MDHFFLAGINAIRRPTGMPTKGPTSAVVPAPMTVATIARRRVMVGMVGIAGAFIIS